MKLIESIKSKRRLLSKWFVTACVVLSLAMLSCLTCFAADAETSTVSMSEVIRTSFNQMQLDLIGYVGIVLPIALTVFGTIWGIKKATAFFKGVAK